MVARSDPSERYVIIEDTLEIQCRAENLVQLHTSEAADLTRLVRATMRLRPDRIIIGEVRGARSAGAPEGMADRASRWRHHDAREFRQSGADAAFELWCRRRECRRSRN